MTQTRDHVEQMLRVVARPHTVLEHEIVAGQLALRAEPSRPLALTEWCSVVATAFPTAQASRFTGVVVVDWFNAVVHHL